MMSTFSQMSVCAVLVKRLMCVCVFLVCYSVKHLCLRKRLAITRFNNITDLYWVIVSFDLSPRRISPTPSPAQLAWLLQHRPVRKPLGNGPATTLVKDFMTLHASYCNAVCDEAP